MDINDDMHALIIKIKTVIEDERLSEDEGIHDRTHVTDYLVCYYKSATVCLILFSIGTTSIDDFSNHLLSNLWISYCGDMY